MGYILFSTADLYYYTNITGQGYNLVNLRAAADYRLQMDLADNIVAKVHRDEDIGRFH